MNVCSVCRHPEKAAINAALARGTPYRKVAAQVRGLSPAAVDRHRRHLPSTLVNATNAEVVTEATSLLSRVEALLRESEAIAKSAKRAKEWPAVAPIGWNLHRLLARHRPSCRTYYPGLVKGFSWQQSLSGEKLIEGEPKRAQNFSYAILGRDPSKRWRGESTNVLMDSWFCVLYLSRGTCGSKWSLSAFGFGQQSRTRSLK